MAIELVHLTPENSKDFESVIPSQVLIPGEIFAIGAYDTSGEVCGAICAKYQDFEYQIDWLYVSPSYRRRGVASMLLNEFESFMNLTGEIYPVTGLFEAPYDDLSLYGFFLSKEKFDISYSHQRYYVSFNEIFNNKRLKTEIEIDIEEKEFFSLPMKIREEILSEICADGQYAITDKELWAERCEKKLCRVATLEGEMCAAIFIADREDIDLELSYLYSTNVWATKKLLCSVAGIINKDYKGSGIIFDVINKESEIMAKKLFPTAKKVFVYEVSR